MTRFIRCPLAPLALLPLMAVLPAGAQLLPRPEVLPQPSVPTTAAPLSFEEIFAGVNPAPLSLKTADLKGEWRLMTIKMRPEVENASSMPASGNSTATLRETMGAAPGQFITQGQTVAGGGELFLVAYRMKFDPAEMDEAMKTSVLSKIERNGPFPTAELGAFLESYARERPLELSLINVKLLGELSGVRAFNAELQSGSLRALMQKIGAEENARNPSASAPTATPVVPPKTPGAVVTPVPKPAANVAARNAASQSNLKQLGATLKAYVEDHDNVLPPMGTPAQAKGALSNYAIGRGINIWQRADTGEAYLPNPMLSGRKIGHISNPQEFVAFYEANPAPDGTRGVAFLNGDVKRLTQTEWPRAKKASKLR